MPHKKKKNNPDDPKSLNFDRDEEKSPSDHLKKPIFTTEEERSDAEDDQYYDEEKGPSDHLKKTIFTTEEERGDAEDDQYTKKKDF